MSIFHSKDNRQKPDYENKSGRIRSWSDLLKSISRLLWVIVIIILLASLGKMFLPKSEKGPKTFEPHKVNINEPIDWSQVNKAVADALKAAREETENLASEKLDQWINEKMKRVDNVFLEWYFGFWTQQWIGLKAIWYKGKEWIFSNSKSAAEEITGMVQEKFTTSVIVPQTSQKQIERIISEVMNHYARALKGKLDNIPMQYEINPADWNLYIREISEITTTVDADRSVPLSLKVIFGAGVGVSLRLISSLKPVIKKIVAKISTKLAAKKAASIAIKKGGQVAARFGGRFLGPIVAIGIIIWDIWDHRNNVKVAKPKLRQSILDYFKEVKHLLLNDDRYGIMTIIYRMEQRILENNPKAIKGSQAPG